MHACGLSALLICCVSFAASHLLQAALPKLAGTL
jgi:hypothetical protein